MARKSKLKVYRTPIGFHDAYVAAPSQKAALEAWGSDADLFARGIAELVDDPELTHEPLARPGTVIRRLRGTAAEQFAALPPDPPECSRGATEEKDGDALSRKAPARPKPARNPKPAPKPDRTALDKAQEALDELEARHERERAALARREEELARERRAAEKTHSAESAKARKDVDHAAAAYEQEMRKWRG